MNEQEQFYLDVQNLIFDISRFTVTTDISGAISRLENLETRKQELSKKAEELNIPFRFDDMYRASVADGFDDVAWDSSSIDC